MKTVMVDSGIQPGDVTGFLTDSTLCIGCKACEGGLQGVE